MDDIYMLFELLAWFIQPVSSWKTKVRCVKMLDTMSVEVFQGASSYILLTNLLNQSPRRRAMKFVAKKVLNGFICS